MNRGNSRIHIRDGKLRNSSVKTRLNMNLGTDKFEFKTSFPSRWDSRLTFTSVWTGKLDGKVRTGNSSAPGFILDEFPVQDEFPVSNMNSANMSRVHSPACSILRTKRPLSN